MKRYWVISASLLLVLTALFVVVEALGLPALTDPEPLMRSKEGWVAAAIGVGLLTADAVLPVPSSIVMVAHGALFGALAGAVLSLLGRMGFCIVGFGAGRRGGPLIERLVGADERKRADRMLERWGPVAIVLSRPVPLVSETVIVLAGASGMSWGIAMAMATVGSLPEVALYAAVGAWLPRFDVTSLVFLAVLALAATAWIVLSRRTPPDVRPKRLKSLC